MSDSDKEIPTSRLINSIPVVLSAQVPKSTAKGSKGGGKGRSKAPKMKTETKQKELSFEFEQTLPNYLLFLGNALQVHGQTKFVPVKKHTAYGFKISIGKKAKTDAVDIDKFSEYKDIVGRILAKSPSKIFVYIDLEEVKKSAKRREQEDTDEEAAPHPAIVVQNVR
ncbi:hypothetical protein D9619_011846 [Psilocybe cf. subviscida]|uniref:Uncharacterized protein n=1 Tax=Psilocybe cf. subviscida TaxID=2480587 RepID=A0A8H5B0I4_9AGAR|nr:hypothetical protein D9619_011846 [Psilocybe cf. subviscida]